MAPIRVGVIGAGLIWTRTHQPLLAAHRDTFQPVAFCDVSTERRAAIAHEYPDAQVVADYERLLAMPDIDTVMIFTPIAFNAPVARAALDAGKHVIMEKPIARSVAEGRALVATARRNRRRLFVTEQMGYRRAEEVLAGLIGDGAIGDVVMWERIVHGEPDTAQGPLRYDTTPWRKNPAFPLGTLFDGGVHQIAGLTKVFGFPEDVFATGRKLREEYGDYDHVTMTFQFSKGVVGQLSHSTYLPSLQNHFHVYGTAGAITVEPNRLVVERVGQASEITDLPMEQSYAQMWQALVEAIAAGTEPFYTPERAVADVAVLEAVARSITSGSRVAVDRADMSPQSQ